MTNGKPDYRGFAKKLMDDWPEPVGFQIDEADLQDIAFEFGILIKESRAVPCSPTVDNPNEYCACAEYCDAGEVVDCYRLAPDVRDK